MFAQYSPLFTSGLMSDVPVSARTPSPLRRFRRTKKHHDSLPVTVKSSTTSSFYGGVQSIHSSDSHSEGFLFTLAPHRRQVDEDRSFLSLDLAESQSMRSMSLRRKDTVTSKSSAFFGRSEPASPVSPQTTRRTPWAPQLPSISSASISSVPALPLRRASRETLRLSSPKPAPSINLPEPPVSAPAAVTTTAIGSRSRSHRPSNLVITLSACFMEAGPSSTSPMPFTPQHRSSHSAPSVMSPISPEEGSSYFMFSPTSPVTSQQSFPFHEPAPVLSSLKAHPSTRSTATVNTRNRNRSAALAALEGRGSPGRKDNFASRPRNFMSMSDDEDEDEEMQDVQTELLSVLNEEEGLVIPGTTSGRVSQQSQPNTGVKRVRASTPLDEFEQEAVSSSLPDNKRNSEIRTSSTPSSKRSRRSTIESFLAPLTNFIDFHEDETGRGWRSFVEVSS
ncbi:hypothetical protein EUX98_g6074 [Antrodiella citrinella]|uniref:Uncharacterized protein n=1 Tax=Antrodiella citrinella TaxID=2447956 RepID=A0A4V3XI72_9APHY|nr:hypothetical protein EUX98_g6074 [Antrodiella citrinella]